MAEKKVMSLSFDDPAFAEEDEGGSRRRGGGGGDRKQYEPKFFEKGVYDVVIAETSVQGPAAADANWTKIKMILKGTGEKKLTHYLLIPEGGNWKYIKDGKATMFCAHQFKGFCAAIGLDDPVFAMDLLKNGGMVGKYLKMETQWARNTCHIEYNKELKARILVNTFGEPVEAAKGLKFDKREEAELFCAQNNLKYNGFAEVKAFSPPALPNQFPKKPSGAAADVPAEESKSPF
jgi:hypothetical protein